MNMIPDKNKLVQQKLLWLIRSRWYFIVGSVAMIMFFTYMINRYSTPTYKVSASLIVKDPQKSMTYADLIFESSSNNSNVNLTNEVILLKSYQYVASTIADLDFDIAYFREGVIKITEIYGNSPIELEIDQDQSKDIPYGKLIKVKIIDEDNYELIYDQTHTYTGVFDEPQNINGFAFTLKLKQGHASPEVLAFTVTTPDALTRQYMGKLRIYPLVSNSSILEISVLGNNPAKEIAFLNAYMENVREINLKEKNLNHQKAIDFINEQLAFNKDTLKDIESRLVNFKDKNNSIDLNTETSQMYTNIQALEAQKADILMANQYYDYLIETLNEENVDELVIPASLGINDPTLSGFVTELISIQIEINTLVKEKRFKNPVLIEKEKAIQELKENIMANVKNLKGGNDVALKNVEKRLSKFYASLQKVPEAQRELISIQRNYGLSENLYMLLMEKKMEEAIKLAGNAPDYGVVNGATVVGQQVSPKIQQNYLIALLIGFFLPIGLMYVFILLNDKITSKEDIQNNTSFPIVGSIPTYNEKYKKLADIKPDTVTAEAFRTLRSDLNYLIGGNKGKVITISSCMSGEGKTYCSQHLAYILALADQKVMLINADLRKPDASQEYFQNPHGLSEYLAGFATYKEIVNTSDLPNLKVINSGKLPPNPSELLISYCMESLLMDLKNEDYNYIILDTAPMGIFSDALELSRQSDLTLFVVRHGHTPRSAMQLFNELMGEKKLNNAGILFNGVPVLKNRYGYDKYYRGYGKKKKSIFEISIKG